MNYLRTFSHPTTWGNIFNAIREQLGPEFYKWDGGIGFGDREDRITLTHRDGVQHAHFLLIGIDVVQPAVAGSWFTWLKKARLEIPALSLRGHRNMCRISFRHDKQDKTGVLYFEVGRNDGPIGDKVYIEPHGWMDTDDVELIDILPWRPEAASVSQAA